MPLTGREKATIFLSMLGARASANILRYLPGELADLIAAGVEHLPTPSPEALTSVLDEFNRFTALPPSRELVLEGVEKYPPLQTLLRASPKRLGQILSSERPQVIAFVLSELPTSTSADVLAYLPEYKREVEGLLKEMKKTPLSEKIKETILESLSRRLS